MPSCLQRRASYPTLGMIGENGLFFFGVGRFAGFQTAFWGWKPRAPRWGWHTLRMIRPALLNTVRRVGLDPPFSSASAWWGETTLHCFRNRAVCSAFRRPLGTETACAASGRHTLRIIRPALAYFFIFGRNECLASKPLPAILMLSGNGAGKSARARRSNTRMESVPYLTTLKS